MWPKSEEKLNFGGRWVWVPMNPSPEQNFVATPLPTAPPPRFPRPCQARIQGGGGALGRAPTPGTEGPAPKARFPLSQGQEEGALVSLEWLFNTIQA